MRTPIVKVGSRVLMDYQTRRVKCDEAKPQCLRCRKFGRQCDGYPQPRPGRDAAIIPIKPRIPAMSIHPSVSLHSTEDESRYFQNFIDHSANELSGFFDPSFWTRIVLQESHNVPPIRHAVIAIGALNKSLETAPPPDLKVNVIQSIDKKHHEHAVLQYLKAIQALNNYISTSDNPQLRIALVACLLFVCFETFQGSYASAVQQTYGGLKILRSYYQGKPGSKPWIPQRSPAKSTTKAVVSGLTCKAMRWGCDNVSKAEVIATHTDEYLEGETYLQLDSTGTIAAISDAFVYDPSVEQHDHPRSMTGTNFKEEQYRTRMALPSRKQSMVSRNFIKSQSRDMTPDEQHHQLMHKRSLYPSSPTSDSFRKSSATSNSTMTTEFSTFSIPRKALSVYSSSSVPTPGTYTPPSTGPHTPLPSSVPPSQPPASVLSTKRKRPLVSRSPTPPPLHNDFAIEEILIQTFVRLDGQGLFFGMIPGIPPLIWDIHKTWHLAIPSSFQDFTSARRCWDFLQDRALQFFRRTSFNRAYAPAASDKPEQIAAELSTYLNQLDTFASAFQPILDNAIADDGTIVNAAALLLSLYHKTTVITLASIPSDSEMVYDVFLLDFRYIVRTSALLIASNDSMKTPPNPRFAFEVGIVPPLHVVAIRCRDPVVRREAVELLFASPRQEGMWDGVLSARIGMWMTSCEEDGLSPPPLDDSRYSSLSQGSSPGSSGGGRREDRGRFSYPSPPQFVEDVATRGGFEDRKRISDVVSEVVGKNEVIKLEADRSVHTAGSSPRARSISEEWKRKAMGRTGREAVGKHWMVPEDNRVRLMTVDFHIPERYIKVKCQKALLGADGTREERETVIAW